ncbi:MAG TPA: winged helix DNA-binding domain-containing protein [Acidimicrobiales bacterium]|nr:winged helix DNA-binding domain-containing protein [Acidimicrobiales bacterium]
MRTIGVQERRARLGVRHLLAPGTAVEDVTDVARAVVVLHATDPATVVLSALARMARPDPSAMEAALYDDRSLVRILGMRRTLFTMPRETVPVVQASSALRVAADERRKLEQMLVDGGITKRPGPWLRKVEAKALAALDELGEASAPELAAAVPELDLRLTLSPGQRWEAKVRLSSRVLLLLGVDGHVVRGRPKGAWTGATHRWVPTARWLGGPIEAMDPDAARVELVRRWLARFGPGTVRDLQWWTGWTLGATRAALAELDTVEVDLDGEVGLVLAEDEAPAPEAGPWVALLPGLDPTPMGWKERDWYLGPHKARVFDTAGNVGPTVWVDGRIVGGWAQRKDGSVVTRLLEDVPRTRTKQIDRAAAALEDLIGKVPSIPRFPAPLDKELRAEGPTP